MALLIIILFSNVWIWKIFGQNFLVFILLIIATVLLWLLTTKKLKIKYYVIFLLIFLALFFFQWKTTTWHSLVLLSNDEQRIKSERIKLYNPSSHYMRVIFYRLDLANFFEGDIGTIINRLQRNFFESLDPNVYFFAGHPRERVWANDFEKFPFTYIIPFILGFYQLIKRRNLVIQFWLVCSITLLSIIGHKNPLGPFILFPIFPTIFLLGIPKSLPGWILVPSLVLAILITIQTFIYAG